MLKHFRHRNDIEKRWGTCQKTFWLGYTFAIISIIIAVVVVKATK